MLRTRFILILVFCCFWWCSLSFGQVNDISKTDSSKAKEHINRLLPGPVINRSPETSWVFGLSALYTFYSDKRDSLNRPSFLFPTVLYTLKKQVILDAYLNMWSKGNKWHYVVDLSYFKYNYFFYGVGNHTKAIDRILLNQRKKEFAFTAEKKLFRNFYMGLEYNVKDDRYSDKETNDVFQPNLTGFKGGMIMRAGGALIFDSRDAYTYARQGNYARLGYTYTFPFSDFKFHRIIFESRSFYSFAPKHTLGLNFNVESIQGDQPFFELRQLGGAFMMRGYYAGRFRNQNLAAGQLEYRWHLIKRFALVGFAGTGAVFKNNAFKYSELKPDFGVGIRYFYDFASGINLRADYGWGEKIPGEGRIGNFYLFVGEAF